MPNRIKEWRTRFGLSLTELARLVSTTAAQIQKLERGERRLTQDWMMRIAEALSSTGHRRVFAKDLLMPEAEGSGDNELMARAIDAAKNAHAPYSGFHVGAAVRANGQVYTGCNVENASYGLSVCAERVAIFTAVAAGAKRIEALALACVDAQEDMPAASRVPCGACRQVMAEFAGVDLPVYVEGVGTLTLGALLPDAFKLDKKR